MALIIKRLSVSGGYLQDAALSFAEGLNCVIGARGTCKSTTVETIRFTFDCDRPRIQEMIDRPEPSKPSLPHFGLLAATLQGTASCEIEHDEQPVLLERDLTSEPRIFRDGIKQLSDPGVLQAVEIYSQGELQKIAEDGLKRLQLIDRPHQDAIAALKRDREGRSRDLKAIGNQIRELRAVIEARRTEPKLLEQYRQELAAVEKSRPGLSPQLDAERSAFERRKFLAAEVNKSFERWRALAAELHPWLNTESEYRRIAEELGTVDTKSAKQLAAHFTKMADAISSIKLSAHSAGDRRDLVASFLEELDKLNEGYFALRKGQEVLNQALRKEDTLRQQVSTLEKSVAEFNELNLRLTDLKKKRQQLRSELTRCNDEIFRLRLIEVDRVNSLHNARVLLSLRQGASTESYRRRLSALLDRSRLRNQEDIAADLSRSIRPADLVDAVEASASQRLAELLNRDPGQMTRLVGFLVDSPDLYDIETEVFEDELDITLYDEGVPKRVDQLSKGQKATAILPLILREASYPLIFDQPEDDLDNRFVFETLVERVRALKLKRQLIFVTHNANIPVLGDADRVIVMRMQTPERAQAPALGTVDEVKNEILSLLEGGAEAFVTRQQRYGSLLSKHDEH